MLVTALILAALLVLPALYLRDTARERRRRGGWFAGALSLFDTYRVTQEGSAWPVLEGRYQGRDVRLELVMDDLAWRKVPSLWLKATLLSPGPTRGTLAFLVRPQGHEFFSPAADMKLRLPVPEAWPQNAILCADTTDIGRDVAAIDPHMTVFNDPRTKELVVTPRGVRLVYQSAQAERSTYLVTRQARFENPALDPVMTQSLLDRVIAITASLDAATMREAA